MGEAREQDGARVAADEADALARLAEASAKLFAGQAAAMTMMTAFGLSMTGQMAGLLLGSLRDKDAAGDVEPVVAESAAQDNVVPLRTSTRPRPQPDDLKRISGIGPRLEKALNGQGITRFREIAAWDAETIDRLDRELGLDGRIARDDWVGQAGILAGN